MPNVMHEQGVFDVLVIGGGMAGLATVAALPSHLQVALIERESTLAAQASGRNAAIYRPLENDRTTGELSRRTTRILQEYGAGDLLDACGVLLVSDSLERCEEEALRAHQQGVNHTVLHGEGLLDRVPWLRGGQARGGVLLGGGGILDIHAMAQLLEKRARERGVQFFLGQSVHGIQHHNGTVVGVELPGGRVIKCRNTVIGAGAWSRELGASIGADLPLNSTRRHLFHVKSQEVMGLQVHASAPVVWRLEDEIYVRPEGMGVLASPCDERAWIGRVPREPVPDAAASELLAAKMARLAPQLEEAGPRCSWACFRTFAPDRELVAGPDPRVSGLHWLSGLGGRGMTVGVAAGDLVARLLQGGVDAMAASVSVERLLSVKA